MARARLNPAAAAFPVFQAGRLPHYPFRGLLSVHSRYGLHARQVAYSDPLHRRLQPIRHLLSCSDCYRLERPVAGWESHPLKIHAFPRRTETHGLQTRATLFGIGSKPFELAQAVRNDGSPEGSPFLGGDEPAKEMRPEHPRRSEGCTPIRRSRAFMEPMSSFVEGRRSEGRRSVEGCGRLSDKTGSLQTTSEMPRMAARWKPGGRPILPGG